MRILGVLILTLFSSQGFCSDVIQGEVEAQSLNMSAVIMFLIFVLRCAGT